LVGRRLLADVLQEGKSNLPLGTEFQYCEAIPMSPSPPPAGVADDYGQCTTVDRRPVPCSARLGELLGNYQAWATLKVHKHEIILNFFLPSIKSLYALRKFFLKDIQKFFVSKSSLWSYWIGS
jgi:hypothetical protein